MFYFFAGNAFRLSGTPNRKSGGVIARSVYILRASSEAECERWAKTLKLRLRSYFVAVA